MWFLAACAAIESGSKESDAGSVIVDSGTAVVDSGCEACDSADTVDSADTGAPADTAVEETGTTPEAACGDATCDPGEDCWACAGDCGDCDCPTAAEVIVYTQSAWNGLADAFLADPSPCADYYISLPANSGDKATPRSEGEPEAMHARGPRMHAMAEFHWTTWANEAGSWYDKGVEFRRRMEVAGYDVSAGDTWAINELPSTVRSDDEVREAAREVFRGLYEGPSGSPVARGAVFTVGMGHGTINFSVYKPYLEDWLEDTSFWGQANLYVSWWAQEVYADPDWTCVPDTTTAERSTATNAYVEHVALLAEVGPPEANTAQTYLGRAYTPLMNAVWGSSGSGYGETGIDLEQMQHFVSGEVYAARAWAGTHDYPDGRLGFAWARNDDATEADMDTLAARLASAIHYAYDEGGGSAAHACSPSGAYTWCQCSVEGATFNDGWSTFESW